MRIAVVLQLLWVYALSPRHGLAQESHQVEMRVQAASQGPCASNVSSLGADWSIREMAQFQVLASGYVPNPDPAPASVKDFSTRRMSALEGAQQGPLPDFMVNGTFSDGVGGVMGTLVRRGQLSGKFREGDMLYGRGGVAQLQDGRIVICRPGETHRELSLEVVNLACAKGGARVAEFMGGGALLIHNGSKICSGVDVPPPCDSSADLAGVQKLQTPQGSGLRSEQMRSALHVIVATRDGRAFLIWPKRGKTGFDIQNELCRAGYTDVVKFDGGGGFFVRGPGLSVGAGRNPSAMLIKTK